MRVKLNFFIILMLVLQLRPECLNWQGTGNMPTEMMNAIWNYINTNIDTRLPRETLTDNPFNTYLKDFTVSFSNDLNNRFHRAWNVVVNLNEGGDLHGDTVLYGYAFRDHWFWYNGFKMDDGVFLAFVIWKDYNCQTYISINFNWLFENSDYDADTLSKLKSFTDSQQGSWSKSDIWTAAFTYVDNLQKEDGFTNSAFSIIFGQSFSYFYFNVCALNYFEKYIIVNGIWGSILLLQMR